jgi:hypothetical protein
LIESDAALARAAGAAPRPGWAGAAAHRARAVALAGSVRPYATNGRSPLAVDCLSQQGVEQQPAAARVASVEPEHPLVEVGTCSGLTEPCMVPITQRLAREKTRCTAGKTSCACRPEAATEVPWCG